MPSPIKLSIKTEWLPLALVAAAFVLGSYFYARFPAVVTTHWGLSGRPDGYSTKKIGAFVLPAVLLGVYLVFLALPLFDPRADRYKDFKRVYLLVRDAVMAVLLGIFILTGLANLGFAVNIGLWAPLTVGLMFTVVGNYLGKVKSNWFFGIRTPWTLSSENVWNKTHRFGGRLFVLFGLLLIISPLLPAPWQPAILVVGLLGASLGSAAYSYFAYRAERHESVGRRL